MLTGHLIKTEEIELGSDAYTVRYFEAETPRGTLRYSAELVLGPSDRIILDGGSLCDLEPRVARLVPATVYSRMLAARTVAA
jgi:hypothetical protein